MVASSNPNDGFSGFLIFRKKEKFLFWIKIYIKLHNQRKPVIRIRIILTTRIVNRSWLNQRIKPPESVGPKIKFHSWEKPRVSRYYNFTTYYYTHLDSFSDDVHELSHSKISRNQKLPFINVLNEGAWCFLHNHWNTVRVLAPNLWK